MFPKQSLLITSRFLLKLYPRSYFLLLPEYRHATTYAHMDEQPVMTFYYFLALYEIGRMAVGINSSGVEPRARLVHTSPTHVDVLPFVIFVLHLYLSHEALDNRDSPTVIHLAFYKRLYQFLIPCELVKHLTCLTPTAERKGDGL